MWILVLCGCSIATSTDIKTYFLNKNYDGLEPIPYEPPTRIECLHADGPFPFPTEISMCFRMKPMSWVNPRDTWSISLGFGTKQEQEIEMTEGILFAVYATGPWIGIKQASSVTYAWIGGGGMDIEYHFQVRIITRNFHILFRHGIILASPSTESQDVLLLLKMVFYVGTRQRQKLRPG